jgi:DNA polymerase IIIc chi subunit
MPASTPNLSIDEQQATPAKRKEDDVVAVAQATTPTAHREQETLIDIVAAARKTLDEARACERVVTLA